MSHKNMMMARIYFSEKSAHLEKLLTLLKDVEKVIGVTVYRGIEGYGDSGQVHSASLIDLSQDLPIVVEFFDESEKMEEIINHLQKNIKPGHIISWPVRVHD